PRERADEVRDEERSDDQEQEEVAPPPGSERDPVDERVRDQQRRDGRDARVDERAEQLLVVIAHRLGEVRELPGELEAGERPRLPRLVAEKAEGNGEEEPQPDDPGQEQHPRRQPSMPMEPPHALPRAYWPSTLCHFEIWSSLLSAFESYWWTV